jgi:3-deoxy-D-manno-octulosonic-acid transferase
MSIPIGWRLKLYRRIGRRAHAIGARLGIAQLPRDSAAQVALPDFMPPLVWFHAASAGELEILWEVILGAAERGNSIAVSIFSRSAEKSLGRLRQALDRLPQAAQSFRWLGFSPLEGGWANALDRLKPATFVTAKYEAWPELWASLGERRIPLVIVSARARRSLRVARDICRALGTRLPDLSFVVSEDAQARELNQDFPDARTRVLGDPRWDRVAARALGRNERAEALIAAARNWPRPWGIVGSAWPEDLAAIEPSIAGLSGTLWVAPHTSDPALLTAMAARVRRWDADAVRTSGEDSLAQLAGRGPAVAGPSVIWVDEHGFLSELYASADWAYVGGGLRAAGLHSVIEPALHGIAVAGGLAKTETMAEVEELARSGQFTGVHDSIELGHWLSRTLGSRAPDRLRWKAEAGARLGAARRILELI